METSHRDAVRQDHVLAGTRDLRFAALAGDGVSSRLAVVADGQRCERLRRSDHSPSGHGRVHGSGQFDVSVGTPRPVDRSTAGAQD